MQTTSNKEKAVAILKCLESGDPSALLNYVTSCLDEVTEKEDECMYWYRQFEDAKETRSKGSVKSRKCPIIKKRGKLT